MYVVVNEDNGELFGPFTFAVDAESWGFDNMVSSSWHVWTLHSPGEGYAWVR